LQSRVDSWRRALDQGALVLLKGDQDMPKVKVVFAGIVSVLAVSATASSSAVAAEGWLIKGTLLSGAAAISAISSVDEEFTLTFGATTIKCKAAVIEGITQEIESPNKASARSLIFKECNVTSGGECILTSGGTIGTLPIATEVTLDGALATRGVFKPKTVTTFATIKLEGANCSETGKVPIKGTAAWLAPTGQDERTLQLLSTNVTAASKELEVGDTAASLKGSALAKLTSALPWSFM
jgi:hypothetical protein